MTPSSSRRLILAAVPVCFLLSAVAVLAESEPVGPNLTVQIPTVHFTPISNKDGNISIPWIAQYLVGVYNYGLTVGGVLAAVMMMWGGFKWMLGKPEDGKKNIQNALVGLIILFGTYMILSIVNPATVSLNAVAFKAIPNDPVVFKMKAGNEASRDPESLKCPEHKYDETTVCCQMDTDFEVTSREECQYRADNGGKWKIVENPTGAPAEGTAPAADADAPAAAPDPALPSSTVTPGLCVHQCALNFEAGRYPKCDIDRELEICIDRCDNKKDDPCLQP